MAWNSITLGDSLKAFSQKTNEILNNLNEQINNLNKISAEIDNKIANAESLIQQNDSAIEDLSYSGLKIIILSPSAGAWDTRLLYAKNAPSNSGSLYSTIYASIFNGPSLDGIKSGFESMLSALQSDYLIPKLSLDGLKIPDLAPEVSELFNFPYDIWSSSSIGDIFPQLISDLKNNNAVLNNNLQKLKNSKSVIDGQISNIQSMILKLQSILNDLNNTGIFSVKIPPDIGGWLDRMKNEPNAPVPLTYSAGICVVGTAIDLQENQKQYDAILRAF